MAVVCFLDLVKCYDTIDHNILTEKLRAVGIGAKLSNILKHYFTDRKQVTKIGDVFSDQLPVIQGSILSACFYNIYYASDLKYLKLESSLYQYADDLAIVFHARKCEFSF